MVIHTFNYRTLFYPQKQRNLAANLFADYVTEHLQSFLNFTPEQT